MPLRVRMRERHQGRHREIAAEAHVDPRSDLGRVYCRAGRVVVTESLSEICCDHDHASDFLACSTAERCPPLPPLQSISQPSRSSTSRHLGVSLIARAETQWFPSCRYHWQRARPRFTVLVKDQGPSAYLHGAETASLN